MFHITKIPPALPLAGLANHPTETRLPRTFYDVFIDRLNFGFLKAHDCWLPSRHATFDDVPFTQIIEIPYILKDGFFYHLDDVETAKEPSAIFLSLLS